jgi:hypothetical protein
MCVLHLKARFRVLARGARQEATFPLLSTVSPLVACQEGQTRVILPTATGNLVCKTSPKKFSVESGATLQ